MLEGLAPPTNRTLSCKIATTHESLSAEDQLIFTAAINDPELWPASTLARQLKIMGLRIADTTIARHRVGSCVCKRK